MTGDVIRADATAAPPQRGLRVPVPGPTALADQLSSCRCGRGERSCCGQILRKEADEDQPRVIASHQVDVQMEAEGIDPRSRCFRAAITFVLCLAARVAEELKSMMLEWEVEPCLPPARPPLPRRSATPHRLYSSAHRRPPATPAVAIAHLHRWHAPMGDCARRLRLAAAHAHERRRDGWHAAHRHCDGIAGMTLALTPTQW